MKRLNFDFFKNNSKTSIVNLVAVVLLLCVVFSSFAGCTGCVDGTTDPTELQIDKATYVLAEGITIGGINVGNITYETAEKQLSEKALSMVKDFKLFVSAADKNYEFNKESFTWDTNVEECLTEAVEFTEKVNAKESDSKVLSLDLTFKASETSVVEAVAAIAKEVDVEPVNANIDVSGTEISFTKEKVGTKLDQDKLKKEMETELLPLSTGKKEEAKLTGVMKEAKPEVTSEELDKDVQLLATATSYSTNTADGDHNMATALAACNGSVIKPGEVWSFNACTGDSNLTSNGYKNATVIMGGKFEQGVGGGICQASTVIYQAALKANLGVYERYCHYYKSSYADVGLDATIDYPNLDLKLENTTDYPIYLQCYMEDATLYASFYGWQDPSFDEIKLDSWIYEENYKANYYRAAAQRTFYKDGKKLYSEDLPNSTYGYYAPGEGPEDTKPTKPTKPATKPTEKPTEAPTTKPVETKPPVTMAPEPPETQAPVTTPTQAVTVAPTT